MAWREFRDLAGNTYQLYIQAFSQECGPSCVATVVRTVRGNQIDITNAREVITRIDTARSGGAAQDWNMDQVTGTAILTQALSHFQIRNARTQRDLGAETLARIRRDVRRATPAIVRVSWGHFVVIAGIIPGTVCEKVVILDPYYGLQHVPVNTFPNYRAVGGPNAHQGTANGQIQDWLVTTS